MKTGQKDKSGGSVLIAEDEKAYARALALKLEREGCTVVLAGDGNQTIENLRNNKFDLLILDLIMPGLSGFEVLETIQKENIDIKHILVISNLTQEEDKNKAFKLGAESFIEKADTPISEIVAQIKKLV